MSDANAGWYDDPQDPRMFRYWDGTQWTSYTHPRQAPPATPTGPVSGPGGWPASSEPASPGGWPARNPNPTAWPANTTPNRGGGGWSLTNAGVGVAVPIATLIAIIGGFLPWVTVHASSMGVTVTGSASLFSTLTSGATAWWFTVGGVLWYVSLLASSLYSLNVIRSIPRAVGVIALVAGLPMAYNFYRIISAVSSHGSGAGYGAGIWIDAVAYITYLVGGMAALRAS